MELYRPRSFSSILVNKKPIAPADTDEVSVDHHKDADHAHWKESHHECNVLLLATGGNAKRHW